MQVYPVLRKYFNPEWFANEAKMARLILDAMNSDFFDPFNSLLHVICKAVGRELRWVSGCYCHEEILTNEHSYEK